MASVNTAEIGFEKEIWDAAEELRGSMDASEYKHVILGLIFLKYLSDKFEERYLELKANDEDYEDEDYYRCENIFYVPPKARWSEINKHAHEPDNGIVIDNAMREIENKYPDLKGILPKTFSRPELDKTKLGKVIDLFTNVEMKEHGDKKDILGRTYEYCLSMFAEAEGKNAGEFYTPTSIVKTIVSILKPYKGRVYDPCCGSGGMFVQSKNFIEEHTGNIVDISIYGQEYNPTTWKMAKMNLAIRGIEADLGGNNADTFTNDLHKNVKFEYIMANPPFNVKKWGWENLQDDIRWKYGIPPEKNANFAWIQHMIHHLKPNGKIGLVLANGSLSSTGKEGKIREEIINDDLIEGIISLPTKLFYGTQIPVSLWFLNKNKKQKGKTLFIDAREMGTMVSKTLREFSSEDIEILSNTFKEFENGTLKDKIGFCKVATIDEIEENEFILTPGRYVGFKSEDDDEMPFEEKMEKLTLELDELFNESKEVEEKIRKTLGEIGFKF